MLTTCMAHTVWTLASLASLAFSNALVRLLLGLVTAYATRKALGPSAGSKADDRLRAHRLAVLRALLKRADPPRR
ncbi:hypothetical protein OG533_39000 [Streptomyces sp. NBC_01186]|uniref:hypothetical protein n=1 Tax=Streptomyces sp. NBC_01186 TaxID=2903765 RepID=UPI002E160DD6|nr:hypothetical protein OG533_39000 [Streptomyces sp. NBC_01186]